jgi:hypothetical protein
MSKAKKLKLKSKEKTFLAMKLRIKIRLSFSSMHLGVYSPKDSCQYSKNMLQAIRMSA